MARFLAPLLAALVAAIGVSAPVLGAIDAHAQKRASAADAVKTSCCGDDCRCGTTCPCVERDTGDEPATPTLAPVESRGVRALCLAAPARPATLDIVAPASPRRGLSAVDDNASARPAGRELLARVSKWTT